MTTIQPLRLPVSTARALRFVPSERRFVVVGSADVSRSIAPGSRRAYRAVNVEALDERDEQRAIELDGTTLLLLEDATTGHMVTHYFHLLEHLLAAWPYVAERRHAVRRVVLASDGRALSHWRGPNAINAKLLAALFPNAEVLSWPSFCAIAQRGLGDRLQEALRLRASPVLVLEDAVIVDRALTLTDPMCQSVNKMLAHFRDAFPSELWHDLVRVVLEHMGVTATRATTLRVTHVLRTGKRRLSDAAQQRLHSAIEALPRVSFSAVDFAKLSYEAQLETAANTDVLLGVHGNGLSHALFLPPHAALIELFPASGHAIDYRFFAALRGLTYLGVHAEHGVIDEATAARIGAYGNLNRGIEDIAIEPVIDLIRSRQL